MKTIIAGSRTVSDYQTIEQAIRQSGFTITEVISGGAKGVDALAEALGGRERNPSQQIPCGMETLWQEGRSYPQPSDGRKCRGAYRYLGW